MQYVPSKWVWSDADFEQMNWSSSWVHGLAFATEMAELMLDIDYPLSWPPSAVSPADAGCWVAPSTLVFENVRDLNVHVCSNNGQFDIEQIRRFPCGEDPRLRDELWILDAFEWEEVIASGSISFHASGYKQYIRRSPVLHTWSYLTYDERGGVSFSRVTPDPGP